MMARRAGEITIDGRELLSSVTIGVRMPRLFGVRMWGATRLFELGAWMSGMNVAIDIEGDET